MTAAHRTLPFGTLVRVTYQGRSVVVRINDRGTFCQRLRHRPVAGRGAPHRSSRRRPRDRRRDRQSRPTSRNTTVAALELSRSKIATWASIGFAVAVLAGWVVEAAVKWAVGWVLSHFQ